MAQTAEPPAHVLEKNFRMYALVRTARLRALQLRFRLRTDIAEITRTQRQLCQVLNFVFDPISDTSPTVALYFMQQAARAQHMRDVTTASGRNRRKIGTGLVSQDLIFLDMLGRYAHALGVQLVVESGQSRPAHWKVSHPRPRKSDVSKIWNYYLALRDIVRHGTRVQSSYVPNSVKFLASHVMPQVKITAERLAKEKNHKGESALSAQLDRLLGNTYHPKMFDLIGLGGLCQFSVSFVSMRPELVTDSEAASIQAEGQAGILMHLGDLADCCREMNRRIGNGSKQAFLDWLAYYAEMLARFGGKRMKQLTGIYNSQVRSYLHHPLNLRLDVVVKTAETMGIGLRLSRRH